MSKIAQFLEKAGKRISNAAYLLENPGYREIRRNGGARDLYRILNKPWLERNRVGTVLDVGANEGQFVKVARVLFPAAPVLAFEPNPRLTDCLRELLSNSGAVYPIACGREAATMPLHLTKFSPAASLLPATSLRLPDFPAAETEEVIDVQVERLDQVVPRHASAPKPFLLKLDVQGFELEVLHGATGILPDVIAVLCEVNAVDFYEGQAGFEEIYSFLRQHNYRLIDLGEPIRASRTREVLYFDVAFLNNTAAPSR